MGMQAMACVFFSTACYCKCGIEVCEPRDEKGLHKLARASEIKDLTGISLSCEEPGVAGIVGGPPSLSLDVTVDKALGVLLERGIVTKTGI
jgi:adenylylsulfate kinase